MSKEIPKRLRWPCTTSVHVHARIVLYSSYTALRAAERATPIQSVNYLQPQDVKLGAWAPNTAISLRYLRDPQPRTLMYSRWAETTIEQLQLAAPWTWGATKLSSVGVLNAPNILRQQKLIR